MQTKIANVKILIKIESFVSYAFIFDPWHIKLIAVGKFERSLFVSAQSEAIVFSSFDIGTPQNGNEIKKQTKLKTTPLQRMLKVEEIEEQSQIKWWIEHKIEAHNISETCKECWAM